MISRRILAAVAILCGLATPLHAQTGSQKTLAQMNTEISVNLPTTGNKAISALTVRQTLVDLTASVAFLNDTRPFTAPVSAPSYKIGSDIILTHPLTPSPDNDPSTIITIGKGACALLVPIHSTQYLTCGGFNAGGSIVAADHISVYGAWALASYVNGPTPAGISAFGVDSQRNLVSGSLNTTFGEHTYTQGTAFTGVAAFGYGAGFNCGGTYNAFFAYGAGGCVAGMTGDYNFGGGAGALGGLSGSASGNIGLGAFAGSKIRLGGNNIVLGRLAATTTLDDGNTNILIGTLTDTPASSTNNFLNIGNVIFATTINTVGLGFVGIATQAPVAQFEVYGAGQTVAALTDAGVRTGTIAVNSSGTGGGAGGAIVFGNAQSEAVSSIGWAAIKAILTGGTGNTTGDLTFATRNAGADVALTERLRILGTGNVNITSSMSVQSGTAVPAGGTAGAGLLLSSTANLGVFFGSGVPTLSAAKGSLYLRTDGSSTSTRSYINTDGGTTWTAVTTAS